MNENNSLVIYSIIYTFESPGTGIPVQINRSKFQDEVKYILMIYPDAEDPGFQISHVDFAVIVEAVLDLDVISIHRNT